MDTIINTDMRMRGYARGVAQSVAQILSDYDTSVMCGTDNMPALWQEWCAEFVAANPRKLPPIGVVLDPYVQMGRNIDTEKVADKIAKALCDDLQLKALALDLNATGRDTTLTIIVGRTERVMVQRPERILGGPTMVYTHAETCVVDSYVRTFDVISEDPDRFSLAI